ncbi:hypothetical protein AAVH_32235, partial [Aphelenchoides avenae]
RRLQYYNYYPSYTTYEFFSTTLADVCDMTMPALATSQALFHLIISANRFTAFAFPLWQTRIWRPLVVLGAIVLIVLLSSMFGAIGPLWLNVRRSIMCRAEGPVKDDPYLFCADFMFERGRLIQSDLSSGFTSVANVLACAIGLVLNTCTVTVLMAVRGIAKFTNKGPELRLFGECCMSAGREDCEDVTGENGGVSLINCMGDQVHSLVMFSLQSLLAFQLYFVFFDHFGYVSQPFGFSWAFDWAFDGRSLPTSSQLFGVNIDCVKDGGCGFLYGVLAGRDVLVGALTVGNLTQHIFSLSGSIFLLVMR